MKKILVAVFSIIILLGTATTTLADNSSKEQVVIDGKKMDLTRVSLTLDGKNIEGDVPAVSYDERTLVPIRVISEALGAEVGWDSKTQSSTIKTSDKLILVKVNSSKITINGKEQDMPYKVPAKLMSTNTSKSARTMVPLRFISEALGAKVDWEPTTNTALIQSNKTVESVNKLKGIETQTINGKQAIVIKSADVPSSNNFRLSNPDRLVVDLRNTNLNNVSSYIKTDIVKEIRTSQYRGSEYGSTEQVSRVVLDISEDYENPKFTTEKRGNDIIVYVEGTKKAPVVTPPEPPVVKPTPPVVPPVVTPPTPPVSQPDNSTKPKVIVIDAGHGAHDGGATSASKKNYEKNLALSYALETEKKLKNLGYEVRMTRSTDVFLELAERAKIANDLGADIFLSIHFNAATPAASGIETFYTPKEGQDRKGFAEAIQTELIKSLGEIDRGTKTANFAVTKRTNMVSALVELGFITNPNDEKKILTEEYKDKATTAMANGIHKFLSK